jgi:hypothetical protein
VVKAEKLDKIWEGQWGVEWVVWYARFNHASLLLYLNFPFLFAAKSLSCSTLWCTCILAAARIHPLSSPKWFACWLCCVSLFSYSWWFRSVLLHFHLGNVLLSLACYIPISNSNQQWSAIFPRNFLVLLLDCLVLGYVDSVSIKKTITWWML